MLLEDEHHKTIASQHQNKKCQVSIQNRELQRKFYLPDFELMHIRVLYFVA